MRGWGRRFVHSGGTSQGRESGRALSSEKTEEQKEKTVTVEVFIKAAVGYNDSEDSLV